MKNVLIVGATGLVGRPVLRLALADASISRLVAPTRRPLGLQHGKLINPVVDFDALPERADWWRVNAVVCTLGTTIRTAGSQAAFRKVDHGYPLAVATFARAAFASAFAYLIDRGERQVTDIGSAPRARRNHPCLLIRIKSFGFTSAIFKYKR